MLPYFKRAEDNQRFADDYHGYGGPLGVSVPVNPLPISEAFLRAAQEYGIPYNPDFNGARQEGVGHYQVTERDARRSSAAVAYLKPIRDRAEPDGPHRRAGDPRSWSRAAARSASRSSTRAARRTIAAREREVHRHLGRASARRGCCCCRASARPTICARSASTVVHDLPGVGANLQDHLDLFVDRRMHRRPHL